MQMIFAVSDVSRSLEFYERAFGWPRNPQIDYDDYVELLLPEGGALGLYRREGFSDLVGAPAVAVPEGHVAPGYLYLRVDDVRGAIVRLEEAGGTPLSGIAPRSWGEEAAWFSDPDGNVVAVAQPASAGLSQ